MGSVRRADYDEVDVRVFEDAVQCAVYPDRDAESFLQLSAGRGGLRSRTAVSVKSSGNARMNGT
jgi:hypothetical protein